MNQVNMNEKMEFDRKFTWIEVINLVGHSIMLTFDLALSVFDHDEVEKLDLKRKLFRVLFLPQVVLGEIQEKSEASKAPFSKKTRSKYNELLLDKNVDTRSLSDSELLAEVVEQLIDYK